MILSSDTNHKQPKTAHQKTKTKTRKKMKKKKRMDWLVTDKSLTERLGRSIAISSPGSSTPRITSTSFFLLVPCFSTTLIGPTAAENAPSVS